MFGNEIARHFHNFSLLFDALRQRSSGLVFCSQDQHIPCVWTIISFQTWFPNEEEALIVHSSENIKIIFHKKEKEISPNLCQNF
jgi:hypothetical protein